MLKNLLVAMLAAAIPAAIQALTGHPVDPALAFSGGIVGGIAHALPSPYSAKPASEVRAEGVTAPPLVNEREKLEGGK